MEIDERRKQNRFISCLFHSALDRKVLFYIIRVLAMLSLYKKFCQFKFLRLEETIVFQDLRKEPK